MRLHFVWIGKTRDRNCAALTDEYLGRIRRYAQVEVSELKEQRSGSDKVVAAESARLAAAVQRDDFVVLLDERGSQMRSVELGDLIERSRGNGVKRMAFVIGGFAGVDQAIRERADLQLSLSKMTLTHELARVILTEQVYRAFTLLAGLPYHRD